MGDKLVEVDGTAVVGNMGKVAERTCELEGAATVAGTCMVEWVAGVSGSVELESLRSLQTIPKDIVHN